MKKKAFEHFERIVKIENNLKQKKYHHDAIDDIAYLLNMIDTLTLYIQENSL